MKNYKYKTVIVLICRAEKECKILTPLNDLETTEGDTVSLVVVLSKSRKVTWLKNGQSITASDRFKIVESENGTRHTLTITNISSEENAEFTVQIDDVTFGVKTSTSKVTVKGSI